MIDKNEKAKCRGCSMELIGKPYETGDCAYRPDTMDRCPSNHFGGFVCSRDCDVKVCMKMLGDMPGGRGARSLDSYCEASVRSNWGQR